MQILQGRGHGVALLPQDEHVVSLSQYDAVVFQKAYTEADLSLAEAYKQRGSAVVFDLCDNHFIVNDTSQETRSRVERLHRMISLADVVTACTPQLQKLIDHPRRFVIDDALDVVPPRSMSTILAQSLIRQIRGLRSRVVWFGQAGKDLPRFGLRDLAVHIPVLEALHREYRIELTVVSNNRRLFDCLFTRRSLPIRYIEWADRSAFMELIAADIAFLPCDLNEFTLCKSANRVATAFRCGLAVVASAIPSYSEFADCMMLGNLAEGLSRYLSNEALRRADAARGKLAIEKRFDDDAIASQWITAISTAINNRSQSRLLGPIIPGAR